MSAQTNVSLSGTLTAAPQQASESLFPTGVLSAAFNLTPASKPYTAAVSGNRLVNSPSSFVELDGVGTSETLTQGQTLYLRTSVRMLIRVTTHDGILNSDVVSTLCVKGLYIQEFGDSDYLKLLEAEGSGTIEWWVGGLL